MEKMTKAMKFEQIKAVVEASDAEQKAEMVEDMLDAIEVYVRKFHPQNPIIKMFDDIDKNELDIEDLVASIDEAIEQYAAMAHFMDAIKGDLAKALGTRVSNVPVAPAPTLSGKITPNPDALSAFLKANGL